ncbi:hypothetical protein N7519_002153 [Penicillium mononematosum]|uniref:uncharacterized protein n=1 Tax=Penicillium mononematosum TaxID=268346 RepID=UPI002547D7FC|nr:uncharacterized protein N7519_002153 [Penicillium mononematosum]KAJ6187245.1 hypothetical protein N7519_002153 [Penicillium mononematosum]
MAITELVFPQIKTDPASLNEIERDWPIISKRLTDPNPGLIHAFRGWVLTENGQDVRDAHKEVLLFEWNKAESFHAFAGSEQFSAFASSIRHLVNGPPTLQLFETNYSPKDVASAPVVEITRVELENPKSVEGALRTWERISHFLASTGVKASVLYGRSSNLDEDIVMGTIGWSNLEDRSRVSHEEAFAEALDTLQTLGEVSNITIDVDAMEL